MNEKALEDSKPVTKNVEKRDAADEAKEILVATTFKSNRKRNKLPGKFVIYQKNFIFGNLNPLLKLNIDCIFKNI